MVTIYKYAGLHVKTSSVRRNLLLKKFGYKEQALVMSNDPNIFNININQNSSYSEKSAPDNRVFVVTELIVSRIQALFTRTIKVTIFFHRLKMGSVQPYGGVYT